MDFSHAGYMGGGVALPVVAVRRTLKPSGGDDDSAAIQAVINEVAATGLTNGFRGCDCAANLSGWSSSVTSGSSPSQEASQEAWRH